MLNKTYVDPSVSEKHVSNIQEERRLNALILAINLVRNDNISNRPGTTVIKEIADTFYDYLKG
jgi:hypothetical protein